MGGAAGFWKDYDAQTRYKYATGQIGEGSFRALADATQNAPERVEMCPTVIEATYVREYITPAEDNDKRKSLPDSELDNKPRWSTCTSSRTPAELTIHVYAVKRAQNLLSKRVLVAYGYNYYCHIV